MSNRKFYRTVISVEVLSEEPYNPESLEGIAHDIIEGDCSGRWNVVSSKEVDGVEMAQLLYEQASEPAFFQLDDDGNDLDES